MTSALLDISVQLALRVRYTHPETMNPEYIARSLLDDSVDERLLCAETSEAHEYVGSFTGRSISARADKFISGTCGTPSANVPTPP